MKLFARIDKRHDMARNIKLFPTGSLAVTSWMLDGGCRQGCAFPTQFDSLDGGWQWPGIMIILQPGSTSIHSRSTLSGAGFEGVDAAN